MNRWGVNRPRWQWIHCRLCGPARPKSRLLRAYDAAVAAGGPVFGYRAGHARSSRDIRSAPMRRSRPAATRPIRCCRWTTKSSSIRRFMTRIPIRPSSAALATTFNSIRNGAYGYNFQYLGNSRTIDDQGDYPNSPYINYPVKPVQDPARTICFADSRGGNIPHGGHSMTLDPPHQRVHPTDAFSTSTAAWGSPSPSLMAGFDPNGPDETGTDIQIYFSPAEERHKAGPTSCFSTATPKATRCKNWATW